MFRLHFASIGLDWPTLARTDPSPQRAKDGPKLPATILNCSGVDASGVLWPPPLKGSTKATSGLPCSHTLPIGHPHLASVAQMWALSGSRKIEEEEEELRPAFSADAPMRVECNAPRR